VTPLGLTTGSCLSLRSFVRVTPLVSNRRSQFLLRGRSIAPVSDFFYSLSLFLCPGLHLSLFVGGLPVSSDLLLGVVF